MVIRVNFGTETSDLGDGSVLDSGQEYSEAQGFGWVTQDSINNANPTPIDITSNTRDRDLNSNQRLDSLIHLQYPSDLNGSLAEASNTTPSAWEYNLADGSYQVTVSVGDPDFTDSNHVINIEGQNVVSGFVPTEDQLFTESTAVVEVTDGRLTIDAIGGENTKLNFVEITPENSGDTDGSDGGTSSTNSGDTDGSDGGTSSTNSGDTDVITVNFGSPTASSSEGTIQDIGGEFNTERGFGWITQDSVGSDSPTPINISSNTRDRNSIQEDNLDSLIHLQFPETFENQNSVTTPAAWEYELADGSYQVTVSVGDPDFTDSNHVINIEGNSVISGFTPTEDQLFNVQTAVVEVTDGRLTIDAIGGQNTKLNFVEIAPADNSEIVDSTQVTPIETPDNGNIPVEGGGVVQAVHPIDGGINVNFGTASANSDSGFIQDIGAAYSSDRGYGWVTQDSAGSDNPTSIDLFANARDRNTFFNDGQGGVFQEPVLDSLIHMQYPTGLDNSSTSVTTPAAWEYDLANGQYEVTVGVGDPDFSDSNHVINVEGQSLISGFVPTGSVENGSIPLGSQDFTMGTATVEVSDGRLTIDAIGGENTKINYVSIVPVDS